MSCNWSSSRRLSTSGTASTTSRRRSASLTRCARSADLVDDDHVGAFGREAAAIPIRPCLVRRRRRWLSFLRAIPSWFGPYCSPRSEGRWALAFRYAAPMSVVIGPPATRLLFENADVKIWMMDVAPGETYPHHYHNHDYVLFYTTDVLATVHDDAPSEHTDLWNARYDHGDGAPGCTAYGPTPTACSSYRAPDSCRPASSTSARHPWWPADRDRSASP